MPAEQMAEMHDVGLFAHAGLAYGGLELLPHANIPLDEGQLITHAEAMTGLSDWGSDASFRLGLRRLIDDLEGQQPSAYHRHLFRRQIVHFLNQRLRLRDDELQHPSILEEKIERPLVVLGLPRAGTTVLYQLLALDPTVRYPENWEHAAPWPAPEVATYACDRRIALTDGSWHIKKSRVPALESMLPMFARMPSQCQDVMQYHFAGPCFGAWMGAVDHGLWAAETTPPGVYELHKRILQQLQWKGPRGRWTLKSPAFFGDLEAIVATYPDVILVWIHREPTSSFVSLPSLTCAVREACLGERPDPAVVGHQTLNEWSLRLRRGMEQRRNPAVADRILDVSYAEMVDDKAGTVANIHDHFGLAFSDEHRSKIDQFEVEQPSSKFAKHAYKAEEFDLDEATIRAALPDAYYEEFAELL
jgi:hypothetical protein